MDKVKQVTFLNEDWLKFNYDGSGGLILRENSKGNTWKYIGNSLYLNDTLYQIKYSEGRISLDTNQNFVYEFEYRDHLGNFRLSYKDPTIGTPSERMAPEIVQSNESDPWGWDIKALKFSTENSQNFIFQKQEKIIDFDLGINWFKYRPFDPQIGRGWQVDRLAAKYPHWSVYAFSGNQVINAVEIDGLEPYILFKSETQAVKNYAQQYNGKSIINGVEYGANVYKKIAADGKTYFAYDSPTKGTAAGVKIQPLEVKDAERVATIHSHGEYLKEYKNNECSPQDKVNSEKRGIDNYVTTPNGSLQKYNEDKKTITVIATDLPSDPKDPNRLNNISPTLNPPRSKAVPIIKENNQNKKQE